MLLLGPTVLEVFNTLLRQLRLSIDYALTGSYDCVIAGGTKIIKEHEERMFQEAIIKTTGMLNNPKHWCHFCMETRKTGRLVLSSTADASFPIKDFH